MQRMASPVNEKLANIADKLANTKICEEKLREKSQQYACSQNCGTLVLLKVNPEI